MKDALPRRLRSGLTVLAGATAITVGAQIAIERGPVPMTLQTLAVLLVGALLGPFLGAAAALAYVVAGILGAPVYAGGEAAPGFSFFERPTGGYLLGFVVAAWLAGRAAQAAHRLLPLIERMAVAHLVLLLIGTLWLMRFEAAGVAWREGFAAVLLPAAIKSAVAGGVTYAWREARSTSSSSR